MRNFGSQQGSRSLGAFRMAFALACVGWLGACQNAKGTADRAAAEQGEAREVELAQVRSIELRELVEVSGTLGADEEVTVAAKVPGRILSIPVDLASAVRSSALLAQIEPATYQLRVQGVEALLRQAMAQLGLSPDGDAAALDVESTAIVRQARATLNEARSNLMRAEALIREGLITGAELDAATAAATRAQTALQSAIEEVHIRKAGVEQRRSELRIAQQDLADTVIRSPIDGVVQRRFVNVGEYVAAGTPIVEVVRIDPLRLRLAIPEREARNVAAGQAVEVLIEGSEEAQRGKVARVAPGLDPANRSLLIEADIPNPGKLRPGQFVRARIVVGSKPALTVPSNAISVFAGLEKVITVEQGKAVEKRVTLGRREGGQTEIVSGVGVGESVVINPGSLQQGQPVRVREGA